MPGEGERPALHSFNSALRRAWTKAGPPSYSEFEKASRKVLGEAWRLTSSTTQGIVSGQRRNPPKSGWLGHFWTVLRAVAEDNGIDPDSLGALEELQALLEAAWAEVQTPPSRVPAGHGPVPPATGAESGSGEIPQVGPPGPAESAARVQPALGTLWWQHYAVHVPDWFHRYLGLEAAASSL